MCVYFPKNDLCQIRLKLAMGFSSVKSLHVDGRTVRQTDRRRTTVDRTGQIPLIWVSQFLHLVTPTLPPTIETTAIGLDTTTQPVTESVSTEADTTLADTTVVTTTTTSTTTTTTTTTTTIAAPSCKYGPIYLYMYVHPLTLLRVCLCQT